MKPEWLAFPDDGFVALKIPRELCVALPDDATGQLIRVKSAEGFKNFMLAAIEAAALVWPEIAEEWRDVVENDS